MLFIRLGQFLAYALLILGALRVVMAVFVLQFDDVQTATSRYFGSGTTGQAIDQGLMWVSAGIVVGLLTLIAKNTSN